MQQSIEHKHDIIYYAVVNLIYQSNVMGAVDVWKCRGCPEIFCEDKRYGVQDLAAEIGFPKIEPNAKWAALVCIKEKGADWTLTGARPGIVIHHSCTPETKVDLTVGNDYNLEQDITSGIGRHRIILLGDFVNSAVDVETGRKHTGPTNANQAPGRPFSFPTEKSAVPATTSRYNTVNLSEALLVISGVWALLMGFTLNIATTPGILLFLAGILGFAGSYLTLRRTSVGPILAIGTSILGIIGLVGSNIPISSLNLVLPVVLLVANGVFGWMSRVKIKSLARQKWHPLDMPAYG